MIPNLRASRKLGGLIRYKFDKENLHQGEKNRRIERAKDYFYKAGLLIDALSAPNLEKNIKNVCSRLRVPRDSVNAFVYASSEIQAACLAVSSDECLINFSSGLITLLSSGQLEFVIGHELGHFILEHSAFDQDDQSVEYHIQLRAQEISVDRLGLLGCQDLNIVMSALIILTSGLDESYLGLNVGQFISQVRKVSAPDSWVEAYGHSHPSLVVRCRALLWFSSAGVIDKLEADDSSFDLEDTDSTVKREMDQFVDGPVREHIKRVSESCATWIAAQIILEDGSFSKSEQEVFQDRFGQPMLEKLKSFLSDYSRNEVEEVIQEQLNKDLNKLENLIPSTFREEYARIMSNTSELLRVKD